MPSDSTKGAIVAVVYLLLFGGLAVGAAVFGGDPFDEVERQGAELARLKAEVQSLSTRADSLEAVADSLGRLAQRSADTVRVEVDRYRGVAARLRRQLDSLQAHAPDTAAALSLLDLGDVRLVLEQGDSLAEACTSLARDCDRAIAAKDSALAAQDSMLALQQRRALQLEAYSQSLADRLQSAERQRWIFGLAGAGLSLAMCHAAN